MRAFFRTTGPVPNHPPSWNIAPTQTAPVVRRHPETGERRLDLLRWGLRPQWVTDTKAPRPINARAETVATAPMFRGAFAYRRRRCLVPADAFYEWVMVGGIRQPFAAAHRHGDMMAFAGLWEGWRGERGEVKRTFTIITTTTNKPMSKVHTRMPVILAEADWPSWLEDDDPTALLRPAPDNLLRLWLVSRAVNSVKNNCPELLDEMDAEAHG